MAISKIYKSLIERDDITKIYKGNELVYEKGPSYPPYVVFKSDSPRTITPKYTNSGITLQYSTNGGTTWTNISSGGTTASSDEIWFRGRATGTKSLYTSSSSSNNPWVFSGDASNKLHVYGDLRYLLCDNLGDNTITFNIASYCYSHMFRDCTSLTTAPELLADTLAGNCYASMFSGCTSLTTPPSLPATTLVTYCYYYMFMSCISLTTAPSLPATELAYYCYYGMFSGCRSLTTVPNLPATWLFAERCYSYMFYDCTSLKVSQTKTESYQYAWRIPTSGTGTTGTSWNLNMLMNTGGTYTSNPTINTTYYLENPPV